MLYLVSTPIGNLADISFRAIEMLQASDYILCEDTRHSAPLLHHYNIKKPLKSYHKFNEASQLDVILNDLEEGKTISLISDAGTPGISDPGYLLVKACVERDLPLTAIPGPCAALHALSCSGLPTERFQFWGFVARKETELKRELQAIFDYTGTTICYESPHRILHLLEMVHTIQPQRYLVVGRELTKKFEEFVRGTASEILERWKDTHPKGEFVVLFSPKPEADSLDWTDMSPKEHVEWMQTTYGLNKKEAIKSVAELRGTPKRHIYQELIED